MPLLLVNANDLASVVRQKWNAIATRVNQIDAAPSQGGIQWVNGNTLTRVEQSLSGETYTFVLKPSGSTTADPASPAGYTHWAIENRGTLLFYPSIGPYLSIGQMVMSGGRQYQLLTPYQSPPTPISDSQWKDIFADAASGAGGGVDPVDPEPPVTPPVTPTSGTETSFAFVDYDMSQIWYQVDGDGGQSWSQSQLINDYTGLGYVTTNNVSLTNVGDNARAYYHNFNFDHENDRKAWIRVYSTGISGQLGVQSRGNGDFYPFTGIAPGQWVWHEIGRPFKAYDHQFVLTGITPLFAVDKLILTDMNNPDVPTDGIGFYNP